MCDRVSVPMHEFPNDASKAAPTECLSQDCLDSNKENDENGLSFDDDFVVETLDSLHEAGDARAIMDLCNHLTTEQCKNLFKLHSKFDVLFNDKFKTFTNKKICLEVDPSVAPHCKCACASPHSHKSAFKKELKQLAQEGVMRKCGYDAWVAGTFITPKKDG